MSAINYESWIGSRVQKTAIRKGSTEPKPFKSGLKRNTVKSLTINPNTLRMAFTFLEDESIVDCHICSKVEV